MLKFSTCVALAVAVSNVWSQDVADRIALECCPCIEGMDATTMTEEQQVKFGLCIVSHSVPYAKELKRHHGIDLDRMNDKTGEKLGILIASRMVVQCPGFAEFAVALANADEAPPEVGAERAITGTIMETKPGQFLTVVIRKEDGANLELLLLEHVANAEKVYTEPATARGLTAAWSYVERDFLDPYTRTYRTYRVITGIEFL